MSFGTFNALEFEPVAGALALAFFIIGLILFVKYYRLPATMTATNAGMDFASARQSADKLYAELQCRGGQAPRQIYMTTEKRDEY